MSIGGSDHVNYAVPEDSDSLCHNCIGDPYLAAEARQGTIDTCFHCGRVAPGLTLVGLSERIHPIFESWFTQVNEDHGNAVSSIVGELAGVDDDVAERIVEQLSEDHGYSAVREGGDDPYDQCAEYAETGVAAYRQEARWQEFKDSLLGEARYFNRRVEAWLNDVFRALDGHATWRGEPMIRAVDPADNFAFYRARWLQTDADLHHVLQDPPARIGPPPAGTARAGRMNAAGISVFYGARDLATCIAEIRPPVGAQVVHARFDLVRPIRLLDLDVAERIVDKASYFDPEHDDKAERAAIIRAIAKQIAWPVLPSDELLGYLPTQVIAEYLATRVDPQVDGIIYRSTQTGSEGRNIVLFNHAARVETFDAQAVDVRVDLGWITDDDYDDLITIDIRPRPLTPKPVVDRDSVGTFSIAEFFDGEFADDMYMVVDPRPVTLRLDFDSIGVERVTAAIVKSSKRTVLATSNFPPPRQDDERNS